MRTTPEMDRATLKMTDRMIRDAKKPAREQYEQLRANLVAKLSKPEWYLPHRGMSGPELVDFAKSCRIPDRHFSTSLAEMGERAISMRDWEGYLSTYPSEERMGPFLSVQARLTDGEYWRALEMVWTTAEWSHDHRHLWDWLFFHNRRRDTAHLMMGRRERRRWDTLPNTITVHRGQRSREHELGFAWTLSRAIALQFALKYRPRFTTCWDKGSAPVVISGRVRKEDALGLLEGRDESEIIVAPSLVKSLRYRPAGEMPLNLLLP